MRLNRLMLFLAFALAVCTPALRAQTSPGLAVAPVVPGTPSIVFGGRPLAINDPYQLPYRDLSDSVLCVAPESLAALGFSHQVDGRTGTVKLASMSSGKTITVRSRRSAAGRTFVPLLDVVNQLGGKTEWHPDTNAVHIRALLTSIEVLGGQVSVKASLPVSATVTNVPAERKTIIDVAGAEVGTLPRQYPAPAPGISMIRTGQFNADTARIVIEHNGTLGLGNPLQQQATLLVFNPMTGGNRPVATRTPPTNDTGVAPVTPPQPPVARPVAQVNEVTLRRVDDRRAQIVVSADRAPQVRAQMTRGTLMVDLLNATLGDSVVSALGDLRHPLVRAVQLVRRTDSAARIAIDLSRVVAYTVSTTGPSGLVIDLQLPENAGGRLAGKLVVVDAGHGDHDGGAKGTNGAREKNVNLAIALALRDKLAAMGANVLMTRSDDTFVTLNNRSAIANRAGADFFISVHADSARSGSVTGSTVYYHKQIASCRALAQAIVDRFDNMGGIPTKGVRSDSVLYNSGLAVLRNSQMVAVLVECGYMSSPADVSRLIQPAMQQRIAESIASGLRDYVEGNPNADTRFVNPRPVNPAEMSNPFGPGPGATVPGPDAEIVTPEAPTPAPPF